MLSTEEDVGKRRAPKGSADQLRTLTRTPALLRLSMPPAQLHDALSAFRTVYFAADADYDKVVACGEDLERVVHHCVELYARATNQDLIEAKSPVKVDGMFCWGTGWAGGSL